VYDGRVIIRAAVRAVAFRGGAVVAFDRSACGGQVRSLGVAVRAVAFRGGVAALVID